MTFRLAWEHLGGDEARSDCPVHGTFDLPDDATVREVAVAAMRAHNADQSAHGCVPHVDEILVGPEDDTSGARSATVGELVRVANLLRLPPPRAGVVR